MSNYGWTNEDGEPIMDASDYRYEQYLDSTYEPDPDEFYDRDDADYDEDDEDEPGEFYEPDPDEDGWLDSYMEDRLTTMFE